MIEIKDISGKTCFSTEMNVGAKGKFSLMKDDYIVLPFSVESPIPFKIGDYVDLANILDESLGGKMSKIYEITESQKPTRNKDTGGYDYNLRLDAYYIKWKNKIFKYLPEGHSQEASWSLTASLSVHLDVFIRNLNALKYKYRGSNFQYSIDATVSTRAISLTYSNTNMLDALTMMAEALKCEWWITDNVIHFGRCEFGSPVKIELFKEASDMTRSESKGVFATRIYAFGSEKNIPTNYRPTSEGVVVNGIVQRRLMLPEGTPYLDAFPNMSEEEAIEAVVTFDVFPHRVGTISDVSSYQSSVEDEDGTKTTATFYRYKDAELNFDQKYILEGQELKVHFESGLMNGMTFGVAFNPTGKDNKQWEIVQNEDYGRALPDDIIKPQNGDKYVLSGYDTKFVSVDMLPQAEQELLEKAQEYLNRAKVNDDTFTVPLYSTWVEEDKINRTFGVGQKIELVNPAFFNNGRISRVIGWEFNLDIPYDTPVYTIGESPAYSRLGNLEESIDALTYKGQTFGGNGNGVYIVRTNDSTPPSDSNVFSALRSLSMFLRKDKSDQTNYLVKFGDFIDSMIAGAGTGIYPNGRIQTDRLEVRGYLKVMELLYNRLSALEGDFVMTESGSVDNIEDLGENTFRLKIRKRWDNDFTALEVDDILRASINNLDKAGEYYTAFYRVLSKNSVDNTLTVVMYSDSECPTNHNYPPVKGMVMHRWGNTSDTKRQNCWYISSTEGRIVYLTGVTSPKLTQDMYASFYGLPVNLDIFANKPINYNEPYLYVRGLLAQDIIHVDHQGRLVYEIVDRGKWSEETASSNDPYLFESKRESTGMLETHDVWLNSCRYRCLKSGTRLQPKWNSPDWVEISGDPRLYMEFEQPNGSEFSDKIDCPIYVHIYKGVEEITDDVLDADIEWTRDTGRPDSDIAWASQHSSDKKFLYVADADCPEDVWLVKFTCKAFVRDNKGLIQEVKNSYIIE